MTRMPHAHLCVHARACSYARLCHIMSPRIHIYIQYYKINKYRKTFLVRGLTVSFKAVFGAVFDQPLLSACLGF